ncbi:MAG: pleckstrin/ G-protein interacting- domain protein, partial [Cyanobacteria bacterium J06600_6]
MQILTKKQVKYCRLVTEKPANTKYCLGVHFQNKLFVSNKFFPGDRRQEAIEYCQNSYLNDGGKRAYLLVIN